MNRGPLLGPHRLNVLAGHGDAYVLKHSSTVPGVGAILKIAIWLNVFHHAPLPDIFVRVHADQRVYIFSAT